MDDPFAHLIPSQGKNGDDPFAHLIPSQGKNGDDPFAHLIPKEQSLGQSLVTGAERFWPEYAEESKKGYGELLQGKAPTSLPIIGELGAQDPGEIAKGLGSVAIGGLEKLVDVGRKDEEPAFDAAIQHYKQLLGPGKWSRFKNYIATQPVEFATDVATSLPFPEAEAARGVEALSKASEAARGAYVAKGMSASPKLSEIPEAGGKAVGAVNLEAAKGSGLTFKPGSISQHRLALKDEIAEEGLYDPEIHTRAKSVLNRLDSLGEQNPKAVKALLAKYPDLIHSIPGEKNITWDEIHKARRATALAIKHGSDNVEKAIGMKAKDALDKYVAGLSEGDVATAGNMTPEEASAAFKKGLEDYSKGSAAEEIDNLIERAGIRQHKLTQSGIVNALKQEFQKLALNPTKMKMFSHFPGAVDRINAMAKGGALGQKILMHIGKAAPKGVISGGFDMYVAHALNTVLHGALGGTALPLVAGTAYLAHKAAGKMALETAEDLSKVILYGGEEGLAKVKALEKKVSPGVLSHLMTKPATRQAIHDWARASKGRSAAVKTGVLATAIVRELNTPTLVPRLQSEINDLDNQ